MDKSRTGNDPLFCVPKNLILEENNFIRILDHEIERPEADHGFKKTQEMMTEILLLTGLIDPFLVVNKRRLKQTDSYLIHFLRKLL